MRLCSVKCYWTKCATDIFQCICGFVGWTWIGWLYHKTDSLHQTQDEQRLKNHKWSSNTQASSYAHMLLQSVPADTCVSSRKVKAKQRFGATKSCTVQHRVINMHALTFPTITKCNVLLAKDIYSGLRKCVLNVEWVLVNGKTTTQNQFKRTVA